MTAKDYRLKVSVRNNVLLEAIERAGYATCTRFAKAAGVSYASLMELVALHDSPVCDGGQWRPLVLRLATFLNARPEELFHTCHITPLNKSTVERRVEAAEVYELLEAENPVLMLEKRELAEAVDDAMETLTEREREIINAHFFSTKTLDDIAADHGVTRERVRQVEAKALRKLRHPSRGEKLRSFLDVADEPATARTDDVEWTIHADRQKPTAAAT